LKPSGDEAFTPVKKFNPDEPLRCSFCHKTQEQVEKLISSPSDYPGTYICSECVEVCHTILQNERKPSEKKPGRVSSKKFVDWIANRVFSRHKYQGSSMAMGRPSHQ
jgi:ClpX C4-type zinc finger